MWKKPNARDRGTQTMRSRARQVAGCSALALCSGAALASDGVPWSAEAHPTATIHEHVFDSVRIDASGCDATLKLEFDAPASGYRDDRNAVRNEYRFKARVGLANGRKIDTPIFVNKAPGRRVYTTDRVTSDGPCWSAAKTKVVKLDVNGCRGRGCAVEPFE